ncbi:MAG: pirin family protein [Ilumatobacter sp.]
MSHDHAIEMVIEPRERPVGSGTVRRLLPWRRRRMVGPFVFADVMGPEVLASGSGIDVDAHPHIGLSTLTYLIRGHLRHRDSTGAEQVIEPGATNWMTAGAGVSHTERSTDRTTAQDLFGMQLWVALPDDAEDGAASFEHAPADAAPIVECGPGSTAKVAAGSGFGVDAPVPGSSPLILAELDLDGSLTLPDDHPERALVALDGSLHIDGVELPDGNLAVIEPGRTPVVEGSGTAILLGGEPVGRRHIWWNFVHSDPDVIEDAKRRWATQEFPTVPGDHDPFVPLPGT